MEQEKEEAVRVSYLAGTRLCLYRCLLNILYQQNKISQGTYKNSMAHVERVIKKKTKQ